MTAAPSRAASRAASRGRRASWQPPPARRPPAAGHRATLPPAAQQAPVPAPAPAVRPVVTWHDARLLGAFSLAAAAMMPADREMQRVMQRDWVQQSSLFSHAADVFNAYGGPGVVVGGMAFFAAGWASGRPDLARLGLRATETVSLIHISEPTRRTP